MLESGVVEEEGFFFNSVHLSFPGTKQVISTLTHNGCGDNSPLQTDGIRREHSTLIPCPSCSYIECDGNCALNIHLYDSSGTETCHWKHRKKKMN